jgi:hypothetical protein
MQHMQKWGAITKVNKADEPAKWNNSVMDSYFYLATENKNKLYGGATTNYKKKTKVRGFTYFT